MYCAYTPSRCQHYAYTLAMTPPPVGTVEIAERLHVSRSAVDAWRARHPEFPKPKWTVGGRPAWDWPDIEAWARATGRLHQD